MKSLLTFKKWTKSIQNATVAALFLFAYSASMLTPFVPIAHAAGTIAISSPEGRNSDGTWTSGNVTQYKEKDLVPYRFTLTASDATSSGYMYVVFGSNKCTFFDNYFVKDSVVSGTGLASVEKIGESDLKGEDYYQLLKVDFSSAGSVQVYFTLRLSDSAADCNGSSSHAWFANAPSPGDFASIGNKTIPLPAGVWKLPSITINKQVAEGDAEAKDFSFEVKAPDGTVTPYQIINSVGDPKYGSVFIDNISPDGNYVITESGPFGYKFTGGTGSSCVVDTSTIGTAAGQMTATVKAGTKVGDRKAPLVNATCSFTNTLSKGSVTIVKDANPNSNTVFDYTSTVVDTASFTLIDDGTSANTHVFSNLNPGSYTFTELAEDGWDLGSISCSGGINSTWNTTNPSAIVSLAAGENVTCIFNNTQRGKIIVDKVTVPSDSSQSFSFNPSWSETDFSLTDAATPHDSGLLTPGTYDVSETFLAGWDQTSATCDDDSPITEIAVGPGEIVTCTFTNTKLAQLTVEKDAIANDLQDFAFTTTNLGGDFNLDDDEGVENGNTTLSNSKVFPNLAIGQTYTVTEGELAGWTLNDIVCSPNVVVINKSTRTISFTPTAGETVTCRFTNVKLASISGTKWNDLDGDGKWDTNEPTLDGWTISLIGTDINDQAVNMTYITGKASTAGTTGDGSGTFSFDYLMPGTYTVTESMTTAQAEWWVQTSDDPTPIKLGSTSVTDVNFGNQGQGSLTVIKTVDGVETADWEWEYAGEYASSEAPIKVGETTTVPAGTYDVTELHQDGYHFDRVVCSGEVAVNQGETVSVTVERGEHVTCTFNNIKDIVDVEITKFGPDVAYEVDTVVYEFEVINKGNVPVEIDSIVDDIAGLPILIEGDENEDGLLDTDETWVYEVEYVVPSGQIEDVVNTVVVRVVNPNDPDGPGDEDSDDHTLDVLHPGIKVVKSGPDNIRAGQLATYTFTVTNTGDTALEVTGVMDDKAGIGNYVSGDTNGNDLLDLDETWIYQASLLMPMYITTITNTVEVCAEDGVEAVVCAEDSHDTKVYVPQILSIVAPTQPELVNTGTNIIATLIISLLTMISAALVIGRRRTVTTD